MDPFFSNATFDKKGLKKRKSLEEKITGHAKAIYLTYPIDEDYFENGFRNGDLIIPIEMPGIRSEMHVPAVNQWRKVPRCFFVGNLYADIRNPEPVISLFSKMIDSAELFFVGGFYGDIPNLNEGQFMNIHYLGKKTLDEVKEIYKEADFLVNIGNLITNQMPSKIFEYICTGKPIINFYKTSKCPTLKYTKKYPLCLDVYEGDITSHPDDTVKMVKDYIANTRGKSLSFEEIFEIFQNNMDENVTDVLERKIEEGIC